MITIELHERLPETILIIKGDDNIPIGNVVIDSEELIHWEKAIATLNESRKSTQSQRVPKPEH